MGVIDWPCLACSRLASDKSDKASDGFGLLPDAPKTPTLTRLPKPDRKHTMP